MNPVDEDTLVCTFHPIQSKTFVFVAIGEMPAIFHLKYIYLMCAYMCACVRVNMCMSQGMPEETLASLLSLPNPSPLRQGLSLSLELTWQPASPSNPPVSISHSVRFHMQVVRDLNSSPHSVTESTLSHGAIFPLLSSRSYQRLSHHSPLC